MGRTKVRKPKDILKRRKPSQIITRQEWGAVEPVSQEPLQLPVYNVMIKFYTDSPPCDNREDCILSMQELQKRHMDEGLSDIAYNFVIGGDDQIYEGRGWFTKPTKVNDDMPEWDGTSLDVAYMGQRFPNKEMSAGCGDLLELGISKKCIVGMFNFEVLRGIDEVPDRLRTFLKIDDY